MKIKTALFIVGMAGAASAGVPGNLTTEGGDHNLSLARGQVRTPQRLTDRDIHVHYTGDQFMIKDEGESQMLSPTQVRGVPDNVSVEQLEEFLKHGHFFLSEQNGEYDLEARVSGKGGKGGSVVKLAQILKVVAEKGPKTASKLWNKTHKGARKVFAGALESYEYLKQMHDQMGTAKFLMEIYAIYDFSEAATSVGVGILEGVLSLFPETESIFERKRGVILKDLEGKSIEKHFGAAGFLLDRMLTEAIMQERRGGIDIAGDMQRAKNKELRRLAGGRK